VLRGGSRSLCLLVAVAASVLALADSETSPAARLAGGLDPALVSVYAVAQPRGLMVTSGGWAYCQQVRALARNTGYTLLCGRYVEDGYTGYGLLSQRRLDWGNPAYLSSLSRKVIAWHRRVGGKLVLIGVSYSGFGVATLASHHPELHPDRLIVIDSFLDLVERRAALPSTHNTARDIDRETGGSLAELRARSVSPSALAQLVNSGTQLSVIWSVAPSEKRTFNGATCDAAANAAVLLRAADALGRPVSGWVTESQHGHDLWDHGRQLVQGDNPGRRTVFVPGGQIPQTAVCS
jgi:pimeloyl-ACP methyl ester carboxylesterase